MLLEVSRLRFESLLMSSDLSSLARRQPDFAWYFHNLPVCSHSCREALGVMGKAIAQFSPADLLSRSRWSQRDLPQPLVPEMEAYMTLSCREMCSSKDESFGASASAQCNLCNNTCWQSGPLLLQLDSSQELMLGC